MTSPLAEERIWFNKHICEDAERKYYESQAQLLSKKGISPRPPNPCLPASEQLPSIQMPKANQKADKKPPKQEIVLPATETLISAPAADTLPPSPPLTPKKDDPQPPKGKDAKDMKNEADKEGMKKKRKKDKSKKKILDEVVEKPNMDGVAVATAGASTDVLNRLASLELENADLKKAVSELRNHISSLEVRLKNMEIKPAPAAAAKTAPPPAAAAPKPAKPAKKEEEDDDDGVDLFGSDSEEEDEAAKKVREQRLAEYAARKSKKPVLIAKSNIILDVKPWDDETDMAAMEKAVRAIVMDGLVWGASKLVPLAYGIKKLQISCVVEDDKVSVDDLQENIQSNEDYVQSVDIAAFNKV
ncbi:elongation factor 1-delta-like isoform X2 [Ischnura elegans]|uniref:elongation factor 1-delta-like isoform X2 n=1 Tax=Ischnura elegans TaxID=197161 RepID=UPI001ED8AFD1|nr:elongation factor 1-delta-like isoform X2 [Ischnura elegans]